MRLPLLLLLPAVALASIEVKLSGTVYFDSKYILGSIGGNGFEKRGVTDNDRAAFQIQDEDLRSAIERYYGKKPDYVFLTPNTPWGNLHEKLAVEPIKVKIEAATPMYITEMKTQKAVLTRSIYENEHSKAKNIHIEETGMTQDTVTSLWTNPQRVSANAVDIDLNLRVDKDTAYINNAFSFGLNRRTTTKKCRTQGGSIVLAAGQKVLAQLEVTKGKLTVQIPYKVSLSGGVTVIYNEEYKGKHYHGFDINMLLGFNKTLTVYQTLSYEFNYGQNLTIYDAKDGYTILKSFAAQDVASDNQRRRAGAAKHATETGKHISMQTPSTTVNLTDEDLKSIVEEPLKKRRDEESDESSEQESTGQTKNKTE